MQCKCNMMYQRKCIGGFLLLTLTAVASNPESSEEQIFLSTWQFNLYSISDILQQSSEIQRRRLLKLHSRSFAYLSILQTAYNLRCSLIWHPPLPDCVVVTYSHFLLLHVLFVYTNSCLVALLLLPANSNLYFVLVVSQLSLKDGVGRPTIVLPA